MIATAARTAPSFVGVSESAMSDLELDLVLAGLLRGRLGSF